MISNNYEKARLDIIEFEVEDVLTRSSAGNVVSTVPFTTEPTTSSGGGVHIGGGGGDIIIEYSDLFH